MEGSLGKYTDLIKPRAGEVWYIRFKDNTYLSELNILDITPLTCGLTYKLNKEDYGIFETPRRYKLSDIEFVEKSSKEGWTNG